MSVRNIGTSNISSKGSLQSNTNSSPAAKVPDAWVRDSSWLALPDISAQHRFAGLIAVTDNPTYVSVLCSTNAGTYTVDWGDGTIEPVVSGAKASHAYNFNTYDTSNTTLITYKGNTFKQAIIQIYGTSGDTLISVNLQQKHASVTGTGTRNTPWLDIWLNSLSSIMTTYTICQSSNTIYFYDLENSKISGTHNITDNTYRYNNCYSLQNASQTVHTSANNVSYNYMFANCTSLVHVPYNMDWSKVLTASGMFSACGALEYIPDNFKLPVCNDFSSMFSTCRSLKEWKTSFQLTNTATTLSGMFQTCTSLINPPMIDFSNNVVSGVSCSNMFNGCTALLVAPKYDMSKCRDASSMFSGCSNLAYVPTYTFTMTVSLANMFTNCYDLISVDTQNWTPVTSLAGVFTNCISLADAPVINISSSATNISSLFAGCYSLRKLPDLSTSTVTNFSFLVGQTCYRVKTIPAYNMLAGTTPCSGYTQLEWDYCYNRKVTTTYANANLGRNAITQVCDNVVKPATAQTLTFTGNPGTGVTSTVTVTTTGTYTFTSTSNMPIGSCALTYGSTQGAVKSVYCASNVFSISSDGNVTKLNHGLVDGKKFNTTLAFSGLTANKTYWVVNATTTTFQLALTKDGAAITSFTNGNTTIGNITTNCIITAVSGSGTFTYTSDIPTDIWALNTSTGGPATWYYFDATCALMNGWTIAT